MNQAVPSPTTTGLLSGHGGAATARVHELIMHHVLTLTAGDDEDYPQTITTNLTGSAITNTGQVDTRTLARLLDRTLPAFRITDQLILLCNTFYAFAEMFQQRYAGELINLPDITSKEAPAVSSTLVVCSPTTATHQLYGTAVTYASPETAIPLIQAGVRCEEATHHIATLTDRYPRTEHVILGCTDLSWYRDQFQETFGTPVTDSVDCAARFITEGRRTS